MPTWRLPLRVTGQQRRPSRAAGRMGRAGTKSKTASLAQTRLRQMGLCAWASRPDERKGRNSCVPAQLCFYAHGYSTAKKAVRWAQRAAEGPSATLKGHLVDQPYLQSSKQLETTQAGSGAPGKRHRARLHQQTTTAGQETPSHLPTCVRAAGGPLRERKQVTTREQQKR